ncbi:hypothetical protein ACWEN3_26255 [Streptomyces sp. NPDC004561]
MVGWSAATVKETVFVLGALEMAIWQRDREQQPIRPGELIHHSDAGSQYTSFRLAEHLDAAGIVASIGSVGDAYDCQQAATAVPPCGRPSSCEPCGLLVTYAWGDVRVARDS